LIGGVEFQGKKEGVGEEARIEKQQIELDNSCCTPTISDVDHGEPAS